MPRADLAKDAIVRGFDRAAPDYDQAASLQEDIATQLVERAARTVVSPTCILDIGCGTGFAATAATQRWPQAKITATDGAPAMLQAARRKMPMLETVTGDAATLDFAPAFDLILSSLALHWLPDPHAALLRWQRWLGPQGHLHVALLAENSFQEWRELCAAEGVADGLWPLPRADFADDLAVTVERRTITVAYSSARDFLLRLKSIGATTPRPGHRPFTAPLLRRLLNRAAQPFPVAYEVIYVKMTAATGRPKFV